MGVRLRRGDWVGNCQVEQVQEGQGYAAATGRKRGVGLCPTRKRQGTAALQNLRSFLRLVERFASWSAVALYRFGTEGKDQAAASGWEQGVVLRALRSS